ncbi:MAG: hypothetical protein ACREDR_47885, partial [Blastocatellia bacterium]
PLQGVRRSTCALKGSRRICKRTEAVWGSEWAEICDDNFLRFDYHITIPHPKHGGVLIQAICRVKLSSEVPREMTGNYYTLPPFDEDVLNCPSGSIVFRILPDGEKGLPLHSEEDNQVDEMAGL